MVNKSGVIDEIIYNTVFIFVEDKKIKTHSDVSVKLERYDKWYGNKKIQEHFLHVADNMLYRIKKKQRNSICMGRLHESNA